MNTHAGKCLSGLAPPVAGYVGRRHGKPPLVLWICFQISELFLISGCAPTIWAQQLPVKTYTTVDGLASNLINRIVRDSRGYLWFCTEDGLSRFDGYAFRNYSTDHGLPHPAVKDILETAAGVYWVGTGAGVCRFDPAGRQHSQTGSPQRADPAVTGQSVGDTRLLFVPLPPPEPHGMGPVNVLFEDSKGRIWCGTGRGLYRLDRSASGSVPRFVDIGLPSGMELDRVVQSMAEDRQGNLWIGAGSGLYRLSPDGRADRFTTRHGLPVNEIRSLLFDSSEQLWAGTIRGLCRFGRQADGSIAAVQTYTAWEGLYALNIRSLFRSSDGRMWVGMTAMLGELKQEEGCPPSSCRYRLAEVLGNLHVVALAEDRDGNLWMGTDSGVLKVVRNGFITYTEADGLCQPPVSSIFSTRQGEICNTTLVEKFCLSCYDGKRFVAIRPNLPSSVKYAGWGWNQLTLQDSKGEWWLPTGHGLVRFPKTARVDDLRSAVPKAVYTTKNGLPDNEIFRLYEDSRGDLWIATFSEPRKAISRWRRATETLQTFSEADGVPPDLPLARAFCESLRLSASHARSREISVPARSTTAAPTTL